MKRATTTGSATFTTTCLVWLLLGVTVVQWALISFLLQQRSSHQLLFSAEELAASTATSRMKPEPALTTSTTTTSTSQQQRQEQQHYPGVAAAIFFSAPAWFHRRYPVLIQNVLMNTPRDWAVQLFVHPQFWHERVLPYHPGLPRLLEEHADRIIVTELPAFLLTIKQPNQRLPLEPWFWNTMVADRVLLWSGNGILCTHGNTPQHWQALQQLDYIGTPWTKLHKVGGDGSTHSYRNRTLMLQALEYAPQHSIEIQPPESYFFVQTLQQMMQQPHNYSHVRLATRHDTIWFGGVQTTNSTVTGHLRPIPPPPMVVSGTQAHLSFRQREDLLLICPELKVIFPSLHEPACFGAHPDPETCKATICALQDSLPSSGC